MQHIAHLGRDDRVMCFGLLNVNIAPWKKQAMEITTLVFVFISVLLIVVQSYPAFDPHCIPEWRAPNNGDDDHYADDANAGNDVVSGPTSRAAGEALGEVETDYSRFKTFYSCNSNNNNTNAAGYHVIFYMQTLLVAWFTLEYILRFMAVRPAWRIRRCVPTMYAQPLPSRTAFIM